MGDGLQHQPLFFHSDPSLFPIPAADISYAVGTTRHGKVTDPHPPGMRVRCSSLEEEFEGTKPKHGGKFGNFWKELDG